MKHDSYQILSKQKSSSLKNKLSAIVKKKSLAKNLLKTQFKVLLLQYFGQFLILIQAMVLARILSVNEYGAYNFALLIVNVLIIFVMVGMETIILRDVARGHRLNDDGRINGVVRFAILVCGGTLSLILVCTLIWLGYSKPGMFEPAVIEALWFTIWLLPFYMTLRIYRPALRGLQKQIKAILPGAILKPALFLMFIISGWFFLDKQINVTDIIIFNIIATGLVAGIIFLFWRGARPNLARSETVNYEDRGIWIRSMPWMLLLAAIAHLQGEMDRLMLGFLSDTRAMALYTVASRYTVVVTALIGNSRVVLAPLVAGRKATGDLDSLQPTITVICRVVTLAACLAAVLLVYFSDFFLGLFGSEYQDGKAILSILAAKAVILGVFGSSGMIMILTGNERTVVFVGAAGLVGTILLGVFLIPSYGAEGAAVATLVSSAVSLIVLTIICRNRVGIDATPFGFWKKGASNSEILNV
jgi:O-antigen/teichoic acid export membrane protein